MKDPLKQKTNKIKQEINSINFSVLFFPVIKHRKILSKHFLSFEGKDSINLRTKTPQHNKKLIKTRSHGVRLRPHRPKQPRHVLKSRPLHLRKVHYLPKEG